MPSAKAKRDYRERNRELIRAKNRAYARRKRGVSDEDVRPVRRHGLSGHPLWNTWHMMMQRCYNPNATRYNRYGGRGIEVHPRWHDVVLFIEDIERTIGPRPNGMTLDRIDNDGNYEPGKVRWATAAEQQRNRTRTAWLCISFTSSAWHRFRARTLPGSSSRARPGRSSTAARCPAVIPDSMPTSSPVGRSSAGTPRRTRRW